VQSETTATATALATGRVGRSRGDVLNAADLHAGAGEGTEGRLGTGAGGLGAVTCEGVHVSILESGGGKHGVKRTTGSTDLDVEGSDANLLAAESNVLGSQHGGVGRRLITIGLDLHATSDTADGFATGEIGDVDYQVEY